MTIRCGLFVDWAAQIQFTDNACWTQVKVFQYSFCDFFLVHFIGAKGIYQHGYRLSHADCVCQLYFTTVSQACSYDVFRYIACRISTGTVNFCAVFTRERTTTVTSHPAVGIYNDFTAG